MAVDPAVPTGVADTFLDWGVLGACIVVLGLVALALWRKIDAERVVAAAERADLHRQLRELEAARLADLRASHEALVDNLRASIGMVEKLEETMTALMAALRAQRSGP